METGLYGIGAWIDHVIHNQIEDADGDLHAQEVTPLPLRATDSPQIAVALPVQYVIDIAKDAEREKNVVAEQFKKQEKLLGALCKRHGVRCKDYRGTGNPPKRYPNSCILKSGQKYVYHCQHGGCMHRFKKIRQTDIAELTFASYLKYIDAKVAAAVRITTRSYVHVHASFPEFVIMLEGADDETRAKYRVSDEYAEC